LGALGVKNVLIGLADSFWRVVLIFLRGDCRMPPEAPFGDFTFAERVDIACIGLALLYLPNPVVNVLFLLLDPPLFTVEVEALSAVCC